MVLRSGLVCISLILCALTTPAHAVDVIVTDLRGSAALQPAGALEVLSELNFGQRFNLGRGANVTLVYVARGVEYQLTGPARVALASQAPSMEGGTLVTRAALLSRASSVRQPKAAQVASPFLAQGALVMRHESDARDWMQPRGKVLARRPVFSWPAASPGATARLKLMAVDTQEVLFTGDLPGSQWQPPSSLSLTPGQGYRWTLQVHDKDVEGDEWHVDFVLASEAEAADLLALQPKPGASVSERLQYAYLLRDAGFDGDAAACWAQLRKVRPQWPEVMPTR